MERNEATDDSTESSLDRRTALSYASEDQRASVYVPNRRGFLAGALASVATTLGFSVPAAAGSRPAVRAAGKYDSPGAIRSAVAADTRQLRSILAAQGYLPSDAAAELLAPDLLSIPEYLDADEGIVSFGTVHDGQPAAGIEITREFDGYDLKVVLYPGADETFAAVIHDDADTEIITPSAGDTDGPSTQDHVGCGTCFGWEDCDIWYDSGGQRWCIPKTAWQCQSCSGPICHSSDHTCSSCDQVC